MLFSGSADKSAASSAARRRKYFIAEAKRVLEDVVVAERRVLGTDNPPTSLTEYNVPCVAARSKRPKEALSLLSDALDHHLAPDALLGTDHDTDLNSLYGNQNLWRLRLAPKL